MTAVDRAHHTYRSIIMYSHLAQVAASKGGGCCCILPYGGVSIFGGRRHIWGSDLPQRWAGQHIHVAVRFGDLASSVQLLQQSCVMSPGPQIDIDVLGDRCGIQRRAERSRWAGRRLKTPARFGEQVSGAQPLRGAVFDRPLGISAGRSRTWAYWAAGVAFGEVQSGHAGPGGT